MFFAFITPPIGYLYVFCLRKNDRRCKAILFNSSYDYDGIMVFEVSSALCVGDRYCCCGLFCVYSKVCEISCSYIDYSYIIIIVIVLYNDIKRRCGMSLIKLVTKAAAKVTAEVVGGAIEAVGEVTNSNFIKDVGKGVNKATVKTGEIVGNLADGTYDAIGGLITDDKQQAKRGYEEILGTVQDTATTIGKGLYMFRKRELKLYKQ